jgi:diguanylate cyclase (GGDEF)-like protein
MQQKSEQDILNELKARGYDGKRRRKYGIILRKEKRGQNNKDVNSFDFIQDPKDKTKRRLEDLLQDISPKLRFKIDTYAFFNGYAITHFTEWFKDLFLIFSPNLKDYINNSLAEILLSDRGFKTGNPNKYSLRDTIYELVELSSLLLGSKSNINQSNILTEIKEKSGDFTLEYLNRFARMDRIILTNLDYLKLTYENHVKIRVSQLVWIVKGVYKLMMSIEKVKSEMLTNMITKCKNISEKYMLEEFKEIPEMTREIQNDLDFCVSLFDIYLKNMIGFKRELYPALLKMINAFYKEETQNKAKTAKIYRFLGLMDDDILSYDSFKKKHKKMMMEKAREEQKNKIAMLEHEKKANLSIKFKEILETLNILFPYSNIEKLYTNEYLLPYFYEFFNNTNHSLHENVKLISMFDPIRILFILYKIAYNMLSALNGFVLESLLSVQGLREELFDLKIEWQDCESKLFYPYFDKLDYIKKRTRTPLETAIFEKKYKKIVWREINQIRKHLIDNFKFSLSKFEELQTKSNSSDYVVFGKIKVQFYELIERTLEYVTSIHNDINSNIIKDEVGIGKKLYEDLKTNLIIDFSEHITPNTDDYLPVVRQIKRYTETIFENTPPEAMIAKAQICFIEIFKDLLELFSYLVNDETSFIVNSDDSIKLSGEKEAKEWEAEEKKAPQSFKIHIPRDPSLDFDMLTEVYNRNKIIHITQNEFEKYKHNVDASRGLCCCMMDIDHFKNFNDKYGHQFGDHVLAQTAKTLKETVGKKGYVGRYGGEEFLVILFEKLPDAVLEAERIRTAVEKMNLQLIKDENSDNTENSENRISVTISIGVADCSNYKDYEKAVSIADKALYKAKSSGRNRVVFYNVEKSKKLNELVFTSYDEYSKEVNKLPV